MIITLADSGVDLVDQIQDQIRGLITTGMLPAEQRLPSVRQLASDLGVAPGTVAKAYKSLEREGYLVTRIGSGTRVSVNASATSREVLLAATRLVTASKDAGLSVEEAVSVVRAIWSDGSS